MTDRVAELVAQVEELTIRNERALNIAIKDGPIDGGHHKAWVIDQIVRALTGDKYAEWVDSSWDEGIPP